ncbi:MAG: secondary thiamine-phosphate synthase enzyme YjbQ [Candidatus Moranbacteria bacterium]|nr:secondary thiamine-phosphate synthase enzyme YjbQ [Candidatus Moranbacteria bacterium]
MGVFHEQLKLKTKELFDFIDLTDVAKKIVKKSKIKNGLFNIQSKHTTMAIIINEKEPLLISDMKKMLERLISKGRDYQHDNFEIRTVNMCDGECANGHSHCKQILLSSSCVLNIVKGALDLGTYQRIFAIELDRTRSREVSFMAVGE